MATTPLIRTPQADGGTFYTFSSSAKDLSRTINNDDLKLVFSKFVLLNLPDFDRLDPNTFSNFQNYMQNFEEWKLRMKISLLYNCGFVSNEKNNKKTN